MEPNHEALTGFPVVTTLPVIWGEQDGLGHVNNIYYLRWCESARIEYLLRAGLWQRLDTEGVGPILARISCDYRRPVTYPDQVWVGSRVTRIGNSSFDMRHVVVSERLGVVAAEVDSTLVLLDYKRQTPIRVPDNIRNAFSELEGTSL